MCHLDKTGWDRYKTKKHIGGFPMDSIGRPMAKGKQTWVFSARTSARGNTRQSHPLHRSIHTNQRDFCPAHPDITHCIALPFVGVKGHLPYGTTLDRDSKSQRYRQPSPAGANSQRNGWSIATGCSCGCGCGRCNSHSAGRAKTQSLDAGHRRAPGSGCHDRVLGHEAGVRDSALLQRNAGGSRVCATGIHRHNRSSFRVSPPCKCRRRSPCGCGRAACCHCGSRIRPARIAADRTG